MTELKTMKEFVQMIDEFDISGEWKTQRLLTLKFLRLEAIKWIKELKKESMNHWRILQENNKGLENTISDEMYINVGGLRIRDYYDDTDVSGMIKILIYFFNITDEEISE